MDHVCNWRTLGSWCAIYITLAIPLAICRCKVLHQAALRSIPAIWVEPGHQLSCLTCGGQTVQVRWQEDGIWLCCPECHSRLPAERYQLLLEQNIEPPTA